MWEEAILAHSHNSAEYLTCYRKLPLRKVKQALAEYKGIPLDLGTFSVSVLTISILGMGFLA